jgi:hypothetical protein
MTPADSLCRHPGASHGAPLVDRLEGVCRAGGVVAAPAPDHGGKQPAIEQDESLKPPARLVCPQTALRLVQPLLLTHRGSRPGHERLERRIDHDRRGDHDVVAAIPERRPAHGFSKPPLGPVPPDRVADRSAGDERDPGSPRSWSGEDGDASDAPTGPDPSHSPDVGAPPERSVGLRRACHAARRRSLRRKPAAALGPAPLEDRPTSTRPHAEPEAMTLLAATNVGLIGALHEESREMRRVLREGGYEAPAGFVKGGTAPRGRDADESREKVLSRERTPKRRIVHTTVPRLWRTRNRNLRIVEI